jgi:hypothetical protein
MSSSDVARSYVDKLTERLASFRNETDQLCIVETVATSTVGRVVVAIECAFVLLSYEVRDLCVHCDLLRRRRTPDGALVRWMMPFVDELPKGDRVCVYAPPCGWPQGRGAYEALAGKQIDEFVEYALVQLCAALKLVPAQWRA